MRLLLTAFLLVSVIAPVASRQQTESTKDGKMIEEIQERSRVAREKGNPLMELESLRARWTGKDLKSSDDQSGPKPQQMLALMLLNVSAEIGNYGEAIRYADTIYGESKAGKPPDISRLEGYKPVDALAAILSRAGASQIILINEAHHVPQHRTFTYELLKALRRKGFTHFAAETLSEQDTRMSERGYPTRATGYYTSEPVYGDLVRSAFRLGYRVVPYEWFGEYTPDNRERGQAKNLVERILKDNPKAKILVHAGYSHIDETGELVGAKTMAQRLKEMTGIDPFTIDQTRMSEHSAPEYEQPLYRYVTEKKLVSKPSVFENAGSELWALEKTRHDVTLFHPRSEFKDGRPTWLRMGGDRKPYKLPAAICGPAGRCLVRARVASESDDAVPVDQVEVTPGRNVPVLMLPVGEFTLEVKDAEDKTIKTSRIRLR
ncbi:MAG: hypothetical protein WBV94_02915 [Blastocatellia bacterium]